MPKVSELTSTPALGDGDLVYVVADGLSAKLASLRVADIAALTAITTPLDGMSVEVTDVNRGGLFVFDTSVTAAGNGGTTFSADDATTGSWVRQFSGPVHSKWFGAVGDGADETSVLQAAMTAAAGGSFYLDEPITKYAIDGEMLGDSDTIYYFNNHRIDQLGSWSGADAKRHFSATSKSNIEIYGANFYGKGTDFANDSSALANGIYMFSCTDCKIARPRIRNVSWAGIEINDCFRITIDSPDIEGTHNLGTPLTSSTPRQHGIRVAGAVEWQDISIKSPRIHGTGEGIITSSTGSRLSISDVNIFDIAAEHGMYIQCTDGLSIVGGIIADTTGTGFKVQKQGTGSASTDGGIISSLRIIRPGENGFNIASTETIGAETDPPQNLMIANIVIISPVQDGFNVDDCINTSVSNVKVYNSGRVGAVVENPSGVTIENCEFHGCQREGVRIPGAGGSQTRLTVRGVKIYDVSQESSATYDGLFLSDDDGAISEIMLEDIDVIDTQSVPTMRYGMYLACSAVASYNAIKCRNIYLRNAVTHDIRLLGTYTDTDKPALMERVDFQTANNFPRTGVVIPSGPALTGSGRSFISDGAPTSGSYVVGDVVYNYAPSASGNMGWVCVTAGAPGTWKTFGAIAA